MAAVSSSASTPYERALSNTTTSKTDINKVIMNYLITEGYPSAAEKFAMEANIQQNSDLSFIQERVDIRESIYRGDLQSAIELINDLNPELLDTDKSLHFSLLRLQLVELIRASFTTNDPAAVGKAIEFAQNNLAPYAPLDNQYKNDLERAMALLIIPRETWMHHQSHGYSASTASQATNSTYNDFGSLAELVDPSLRCKIAKEVNDAILESQGKKREANIRYLIHARSWAEQIARQRNIDLPAKLELDLDKDTSKQNNGSNGHHGDTEMSEANGNTITRHTNISER